jgi:hypothetical protein
LGLPHSSRPAWPLEHLSSVGSHFIAHLSTVSPSYSWLYYMRIWSSVEKRKKEKHKRNLETGVLKSACALNSSINVDIISLNHYEICWCFSVLNVVKNLPPKSKWWPRSKVKKNVFNWSEKGKF